MTPFGLSWRSARREPARALLGIVGIASVGALLFNMLLLSRGLLVSFGDLLGNLGFDVRVTATDAMPAQGPPIREARGVADAIRTRPEVQEVVPVCFGRGMVVRPEPPGTRTGQTGHSEIDLFAYGPRSNDGRAWTIVQGESLSEASRSHRAPDPHPVLVNRPLAAAFGLAPGSLLRIAGTMRTGSEASAAPSLDFRVAGVADFPFQAAGDLIAGTTLEALRALRGSEDDDQADLFLISSTREAGADAAVAAIRGIRPDLHTFSNEQFLTRISRTDFSYFRQISYVLSSVTLFFAFLLVATLLTVAVNQRFAEVAALRAIGFTRRRVAADLLAESAFLVGSGAVLALPLGAGLSYLLDAILRTMPGVPERLHFFVFEGRTILLFFLSLAIAGFLAALYPVWLAVRLPIASTLRKETIS